MSNRLRLIFDLAPADIERWKELADKERRTLKQTIYEAMQTAVARGTVR